MIAGIGLLLLTITNGVLTPELLAHAIPIGSIGVGVWILLGRGVGPLGADVDAVQAAAISAVPR